VGWWVWGSVTWIGEKMCVSVVVWGGATLVYCAGLVRMEFFLLLLLKMFTCAPSNFCSRAPSLTPNPARGKTYLNLQEILRDPVYLLEALRVRVRACARKTRRHELLRLALALLLLLGLRLLRLLRWVGAGRLRGLFGAGVDALHFGRGLSLSCLRERCVLLLEGLGLGG
jgi:hypothetical protein